MTITLRGLPAVVAIAFVGLLGGLAIGQVTHAQSAGTSTESAQLIHRINSNVNRIAAVVGKKSELEVGTLASYLTGLGLDIEKIKDMSLIICSDVDKSPEVCRTIFTR